MAEIYGDRMHGTTRAKWMPLVIGALIIAALIVAIALMRQ